ncbi:MAG: DUF4292 domain-containing protein [Cyclobacteriaceae bacterium]|nr:DUF4292 domain-containing protein [Cyclobacteriaceae bacterium]
MNKYFSIGVVLMLALGFVSCKKELSTAGRKNLEGLAVEQIDFDYFSSRSRISYDQGDKSIRGIANIRMKKDSIIWLSLSPSVGVEVSRAVITEDSIVVINRLDKNYSVIDYGQMSKDLGFKVDFQLMQSVILGNLPIPFSHHDRLQKEQEQLKIEHKDGFLVIESYINNQNKKLETMLMRILDSKNSLSLQYADFGRLDQYQFAHSCNVKMVYDADYGLVDTSIEIEHQKPELSLKPLKFPFNVPARYERKQ